MTAAVSEQHSDAARGLHAADPDRADCFAVTHAQPDFVAIAQLQTVGQRRRDHDGVSPAQLRAGLRQFLQPAVVRIARSEEHTSELQSLMRISYAVFCLKKNRSTTSPPTDYITHTMNHHI